MVSANAVVSNIHDPRLLKTETYEFCINILIGYE